MVFSTPKACPLYQINYFTRLIQPYSLVFAIILVTIGAYLFFFGHANRSRTIFYCFFPIVFMLLSSVFFDWFTSKPNKNWANWILLCIIAGITFEISVFLAIYKRIGIKLLAMCTGFALGWLLVSFLPWSPKWLCWLIVTPITIGAGVFAYYKKSEVKLIQGSIIGTYYIARGVSLIIGGFQNEYEVYVKLTNRQTLSRWFYLYLLCITLACVFSVYL